MSLEMPRFLPLALPKTEEIWQKFGRKVTFLHVL
jgi:hypothetical protein